MGYIHPNLGSRISPIKSLRWIRPLANKDYDTKEAYG